MMKDVGNRVQVAREALIAWYQCEANEQRDIVSACESLSGMSPEAWPKDVAKHLRSEESLYLLLPNDYLRAIFRLEPTGKMTIVDIFLQQLLDNWYRRKLEVVG